MPTPSNQPVPMFFVVAKVFWIAVQPLSLVLLLCLFGLLGLWRGLRRTGICMIGAGVTILFLFSYTSLGALMIEPLEDRFARPITPPSSVSAIIVLGGATSSRISGARRVTELNMAADRMTEALRLARTYPQAQVIFTGGLGVLVEDASMETEAQSARRFFMEQGIGADRLVLEDQARNTAENVALSKGLIAGGDGATILVTSAFHMPRSVGLFRKNGTSVVPWPVDYRSTGQESFDLDIADPSTNMQLSSVAIREWVGLVAYYVSGKIGEIFPSP